MDFNYDPESDVMAIKLTNKPSISYAEEMGDVVVHFNDQNKPVYLEILNSKSFFKQAFVTMPKKDLAQFITTKIDLPKNPSHLNS